MPSDADTLMEMGFSRNRAEKALSKTGYKGVQVAMDWLFAHSDDPDIDDPFEAPKGYVLSAEPSAESGGMETEASSSASTETPMEESKEGQQEEKPQEAKSFKCDECGKHLRNEDAVQFHAAKSGHSAFSESTEEVKPLTAEEKKAQLDKIQQTLKQRRMEKEAQEKREQLEREKARRTSGKEIVSAKAKLQEDEMKRIAEQKRREKAEEKLARQKVREQIEKDKKDRAIKFAKKSTDQPAAPVVANTAPVKEAPKKDYSDCRLQIRLSNGKAITQTFSAKEPLAAVRVYVELNRTDGSAEPFTFMTTFPRKVFTVTDMDKPLSELGLVPSAVLVLTKPQ